MKRSVSKKPTKGQRAKPAAKKQPAKKQAAKKPAKRKRAALADPFGTQPVGG